MPYNVDNKPLNSKKNMRGAVSFMEKKNEPRFKSADFFYMMLLSSWNTYIIPTNHFLERATHLKEKSLRHGPVFYNYTVSQF